MIRRLLCHRHSVFGLVYNVVVSLICFYRLASAQMDCITFEIIVDRCREIEYIYEVADVGVVDRARKAFLPKRWIIDLYFGVVNTTEYDGNLVKRLPVEG